MREQDQSLDCLCKAPLAAAIAADFVFRKALKDHSTFLAISSEQEPKFVRRRVDQGVRLPLASFPLHPAVALPRYPSPSIIISSSGPSSRRILPVPNFVFRKQSWVKRDLVPVCQGPPTLNAKGAVWHGQVQKLRTSTCATSSTQCCRGASRHMAGSRWADACRPARARGGAAQPENYTQRLPWFVRIDAHRLLLARPLRRDDAYFQWLNVSMRAKITWTPTVCWGRASPKAAPVIRATWACAEF